ncbi:MAG: hypothetical protein ACI88A_001977 [Paraglaciecola sp.]|jgi:hypothetical protein
MYNQILKTIMALLFICSTLLSAEQYDSKSISIDEAAVKSVVINFLIAAGNYDTEAMPAMFTTNANIGGASFKNGKWSIFTMTLKEFLTALQSATNPSKYTEPVSKFTIFIEKGKLAFVKADATLLVEGKPRSYNFDYFTLLKENDTWKILNGSYVSVPID